MKSLLLGRCAKIAALGWLFIAVPVALATPPRQLYGITTTGVVYQFDKTTGAAVQKRALDAARLDCGKFFGLLFYNDIFYTTCQKAEGQSLAGHVIKFSFRTGDETVLDTLTEIPPRAPGTFVGGFDRMLSMNPSTQRLVIAARVLLQDTQFYPDEWVPYDPAALALSGSSGTPGDPISVPVCGSNPVLTASLVRFKNPYQSGPNLAAAGISGLNASAIGIYNPTPYPGCLQVDCILQTPSTNPQTPETYAGNNAYYYDTMRFDTASGELWAVSYDPNFNPEGVNQPSLVKMRSSDLHNYCTGTYDNYPFINPSVDDTPRIIGHGTITGGPITGVDFAEDYFDFPIPPPPPPDVPAADDCEYYPMKKSMVCM